jgi:biopolymer transport protein ExbB
MSELSIQKLWRLMAGLLVLLLVASVCGPPAVSQETGPQSDEKAVAKKLTPEEIEKKAEAALAEAGKPAEEDGEPALAADTPSIDLLNLMFQGGYLMLPIVAMSILVVAFGIERSLGLRRHKVLPPEIVEGLGRLASRPGGFDPRAAYKLCQQHPSAAANVIRAMLLKVGRPQTEVEHALAEGEEREAAKLYTNVRWLSLAAGVAPLLGLLGTVWGMIQAFFATANLPTGANKAEYLAKGIYVALVTTFAGLAVAIPAAILAHWFEGRIQRLFRELDETLLGLMPQLEKFEGRLRVSKDQLGSSAIESEGSSGDGTARSRREERAPEARRPNAAPG